MNLVPLWQIAFKQREEKRIFMQANNSNGKVLKAGIWYTISNFVVKAAGFITTPIFTRLLVPEDVGFFSNIQSWFNILVIITTFDLFSAIAVARFDYKDDLNEYIASTLLLGSLITGTFYIIALVFWGFFTELFQMDSISLHLVMSYCLVYPALQMYQMKARIEYNYRASVALSLGSVLGSTLCSLCMVLICSNKLFGRVTGFYAPVIILNLGIYIILIRKARFISTKYWRYALAISIPLIWHTLAGNLLNSSDRIMITRFCGTSDNALYSIAYSCAIIVSVLWASMNTAWSPWAYEKMEEKNYLTLKKASRPYILFFGFVVFCFLMVAPEVLMLMGGSKYASSISVIPPVMIGYVFQFIYSLYVNIEFYSKKQSYIAVGTTIAAITNIILNWIFIPIYGYVAAAYTTLIGYIVLFIVHFLFVRKLGKLSWYDTRFNLLFLAGSLIAMFISLLLYHASIIRYFIIGLLFLMGVASCWKLRGAIVETIKTKSLKPIMEHAKELIPSFLTKGN